MAKKTNKKQETLANTVENIPMQSLAVTRYTYDTWMKCYPDSNREEWLSRTMPKSALDFFSGMIMQLEGEDGDKEGKYDELDIKLVTLDEEYFDWLGDRKNTSEMRAKYADQVSENDAARLAKKNEMNYTYSICVYPMTIIPNEMKKRSISEKSRLAFENYLKKVFKGLDICVIPKLIHIEEVELREEEIANIGESYFKTGKVNQLSRWKQDNVDKEQIDLYGFPIVFREAHNYMVFSVMNDIASDENFVKREMNEVALTKDVFDVLEIKDLKPILESEELQLIKKDLGVAREPKDNFLEFLVGSWEIEEHYAMFLEEYNNVLQQVVSSMDTVDLTGIGPNRWRF